MTSSEFSTMSEEGFPPGHPAGSDQFVSGGAVVSGRSQGAGGSLGDDLQIHGKRPDGRNAADLPVAETSPDMMPTIMIAVEDSDESVEAVRTAHRLFGDRATYFVVNVGQGQYSSMRWAYVYPVMTPAVWYPNAWTDDEADVTPTGDERAKQRAASVAESAELEDVTAVGDVGDPATAIIQAAHEHAVDVVVIASHDRSWFSRLLSGSVEHELLRDADFAVLVLK